MEGKNSSMEKKTLSFCSLENETFSGLCYGFCYFICMKMYGSQTWVGYKVCGWSSRQMKAQVYSNRYKAKLERVN